MNSPEISIVIPLFNEFRWLNHAIESVKENGFDAWEVIFVNDGSPADPMSYLQDALRDPRFHYLEKPHEGIAGARNHGVREATGRWVAFLDQDDRTLPGRFQKQMEAASSVETKEAPAVIYSDYERMDEAGRTIDRYISREVPAGREFKEFLSDRGLVALGTALMDRDWFWRVGGFDPALPGFDEGDLCLRIASAGGRFLYVPGVVHQWRNHPHNAMKSGEFAQARTSYIEKVRKLAQADPRIKEALAHFEARSWYALGLYYAERGQWGEAHGWCWKAWQRNPLRFDALYLALKARCRCMISRRSGGN